MKTILKATGSVLIGIVTFAVIGVAVTELLAPHIWPSAMVGLPVGIFAGVAAVPLTYVVMTYWSEKQQTGSASSTTQSRIWMLIVGLIGFLSGGGLAMGLAFTQTASLATAVLLVGVPAGSITAVLSGYLAFRQTQQRARSSQYIIK